VGGKRQCSIGFSGVLFGLVAWSVITTGGLRWYNIAMVVGLLITNIGPHISVRGHVIGAVTGLVLALIYNAVRPESSAISKRFVTN
jgi:membrane associated rhomboid family serine protease